MRECSPPPCVTCHVSHVTFHGSLDTCHIIFFLACFLLLFVLVLVLLSPQVKRFNVSQMYEEEKTRQVRQDKLLNEMYEDPLVVLIDMYEYVQTA